MDENIASLILIRNGDREEENRFVTDNMGLVRSIVKRFLYSGIDFEDLCQIGSIGLVKAMRNFDIERGVKFSTYAVPVIIGELRRFLRDNGAIKVSRTIRENNLKLRRAQQDFVKENERSPTIDELSAITSLDRDDVMLALFAADAPASLDEAIGTDTETTLGDIISTDSSISEIDMLSLRDGISHLEKNDRRIISLRYFCGKTQQQTADILNMTQVQVSRREKKILAGLAKCVSIS